jgi:alkylhydroperoxidase family enzyme
VDRCVGVKPSGERCGALAPRGSEYCWNHDPRYAEERQRKAKKGARLGGRGRINPVSAELRRLQGVFEKLCDDVLEGNVDKSAAAVAIQALNGARACVTGTLKAREQEEFEVRLQELEEALQRSS